MNEQSFTVKTVHGVVYVKPGDDGTLILQGPGTYGCRETIKAASRSAGVAAAWDADTKTWAIAKGVNLKEALPPFTNDYSLPREEWTRDMWQSYSSKCRGFIGACCKNASAYEEYMYGPLCYSCERHGKTKNDYCGT